MTKWTGRLRQLLDQQKKDIAQEAQDEAGASDNVESEGWEYLSRVRAKLHKLVEDFARGWVNRAQFEELYSHYLQERDAIERLIATQPSNDAWRMAVTEGHSVNIRRRLAARVLGYAVYVNRDHGPLRVYGEFASLNTRWIEPLLGRIREEVTEPFVTTSFPTGSEEAVCLCAVAGEFTTLLVLFTSEPARIQIQLLEDLHCHFEQANNRMLMRDKFDDLVFPFAAAFE